VHAGGRLGRVAREQPRIICAAFCLIEFEFEQMQAEAERPSVLRVDPGAAEWLAALRARQREVPQSLRPLLLGRSRVELSQAEAEAVLRWASDADWNGLECPPLSIYYGAGS
jgi:hypothetical protein